VIHEGVLGAGPHAFAVPIVGLRVGAYLVRVSGGPVRGAAPFVVVR